MNCNMKHYTNFRDALDDYTEKKEKQKAQRLVFALIIIICVLVFLTKCSDDNPSQVVVTDDTPGPVVPVDPGPDPEHGPPVIALMETNRLYFYDGDTVTLWGMGQYTQQIKSQVYLYGQKIYHFDADGRTVQTDTLDHDAKYARLSGADFWTVRQVSAEEAQDAGRLPRIHSEFNKNNVVQGAWGQYTTVEFSSIDGGVFAKGDSGGWRHINGSLDGFHTVDESGPFIHSFESSIKTAVFNGVDVSWTLNFFNGASEWLFFDGVWYSGNGYTFNGVTLDEYGSGMQEFRSQPYITGYTEAPVLLKAGVYNNRLYWIECNSGYIIELNPANDTLSLGARLYSGNGTRSAGLIRKPELRPVMLDGVIYFRDFSSDYYRHNLSTGLTGHFVSGMQRVVRY